jgi:hypothetical protein
VPHSSGWQPLSFNRVAVDVTGDAIGEVTSWFLPSAQVEWIFWCAGEWRLWNIFNIWSFFWIVCWPFNIVWDQMLQVE